MQHYLGSCTLYSTYKLYQIEVNIRSKSNEKASVQICVGGYHKHQDA